MKLPFLCVGLVLSATVSAQQTPADVTAAQVSIYKTGLDRGCRDAGQRKGDPAENVNSFCDCMTDTLDKSMTEEDWQRAYFFSVNKQGREEMRVLEPHMAKLRACRPAPKT